MIKPVDGFTCCAFASAEWLLNPGDSPLFGREPEALRQKLERIHVQLGRADVVDPAVASLEPPSDRRG